MRRKRRTPQLKSPLWLQKTKEMVLDIVYPEGAICLGCGKISDGRCLCAACREELLHSGMLYAWERRDVDGVDVWSARLYSGLARRLVWRLKYEANACVAKELAEVVVSLPKELVLSPGTIVTWVPMPAGRRRERCVDHGRMLAEETAKKLRLLCRQLLIRQDERAHTQEGLNREKRIMNLANAFVPRQRVTFPVLLIDDVLTTGTTAGRCIRALRDAGARDITVLTFTHTR